MTASAATARGVRSVGVGASHIYRSNCFSANALASFSVRKPAPSAASPIPGNNCSHGAGRFGPHWTVGSNAWCAYVPFNLRANAWTPSSNSWNSIGVSST